jgi:hypothetical protein
VIKLEAAAVETLDMEELTISEEKKQSTDPAPSASSEGKSFTIFLFPLRRSK